MKRLKIALATCAAPLMLASPAMAGGDPFPDDPPPPVENCNGVTCTIVVCEDDGDCAVVEYPDPGYRDPFDNVP